MNQHDWLAEQFEANRTHLQAVAYRMLGSLSEADDAVQEAWLRVSRADSAAVENLGGWLTTVVARLCLNMLQARRTRREERLDADQPEPTAGGAVGADPQGDMLLAEAVGPALLVVLDRLSPAERVAFVLHDVFGVPFDEIAPVVGRTAVAARQLASRARRRVQASPSGDDPDPGRQRAVVEAFLTAARTGDFAGLLALLDPDVALRSDAAAARSGAPADIRGAMAVARFFSGRAEAAKPALVGGVAGAAWAPGGVVRVAFAFTFRRGTIAAIDIDAHPDALAALQVRIDGDGGVAL